MSRPAVPPVNDGVSLALAALAEFLVERVPELAGRVLPIGADFADDCEPPWLAIRQTGIRSDTYLSPAEEVDDSLAKSTGGTGGQITVCVGQYSGPVELVLSCNQPADRAAFQAAIKGALLGAGGLDEDEDDLHGVVVLALGAVRPAGGTNTTAYQANCAFALDGAAEWDDEKAFTSDRRATLSLQLDAPLLINRRVPGTMEELLVASTPNMDTPADSVPVSTVQVAEDGAITSI